MFNRLYEYANTKELHHAQLRHLHELKQKEESPFRPQINKTIVGPTRSDQERFENYERKYQNTIQEIMDEEEYEQLAYQDENTKFKMKAQALQKFYNQLQAAKESESNRKKELRQKLIQDFNIRGLDSWL